MRVSGWRRGFTLIEIMVVVAIIGLIMAMGVPTLYRVLHKTGFRKTMSDFMDMCDQARSQAILHGQMTEIVFHPRERWCGLAGKKVEFPDNVSIEMLDVNLHECKDAEWVPVRFFPNGTSDEMTLILRTDTGEYRRISLELTTALASVDSDPNKWR